MLNQSYNNINIYIYISSYNMEQQQQQQKSDIHFPNEMIHNIKNEIPLHYKICLAIPKSVKHILWFLSVQGENLLCFIEFDTIKNQLSNSPYRIFHTMSSTLNETIALGSIIPSSSKNEKEQEFFVIEDICMFQGKNLQNTTFSQKLPFIKELLTFQINIQSIHLVFPVFWERDTETPILTIPYPFYIQYRPLDKIEPYLNIFSDVILDIEKENFTTVNYRQIFEIKATLQSDIYELYAYDKKENPVFYDIAYIPNCKNSIYMNELFMENDSIDSFDDYMIDVVENRKIDTKKCIKMECVYYLRFKRWIPIRVITDTNCHVILIDTLPTID